MSWPPPWAGDTKAKRQLARSAGGATGGDNVHLGPRTLWVTTPRGFILGGGWRETASPPSLPDWNRQPPQSRVVGIWSFHTVGGAAMRQRTFQASAVAFTSDCSSPLSGPCSTRMASDIHQLPGGRGRNGWSSSWPWWNDAVAGPGGPVATVGRDGEGMLFQLRMGSGLVAMSALRPTFRCLGGRTARPGFPARWPMRARPGPGWLSPRLVAGAFRCRGWSVPPLR